VQLDAKQRKLIWPDTKRLDLGQSVRRIKKEYPNLPNGKIEDYLLYWIEGDYTRKAIPRRNYGSLTDSPGDGSPTICVTPNHRKIGNELATLELL
jgi:hypothetical protein